MKNYGKSSSLSTGQSGIIRTENFDKAPTNNGKIIDITSYMPGKVVITADVYLTSSRIPVLPDTPATDVGKYEVVIQRIEIALDVDKLPQTSIDAVLKSVANDLRKTYFATQRFKSRVGQLPHEF